MRNFTSATAHTKYNTKEVWDKFESPNQGLMPDKNLRKPSAKLPSTLQEEIFKPRPHQLSVSRSNFPFRAPNQKTDWTNLAPDTNSFVSEGKIVSTRDTNLIPKNLPPTWSHPVINKKKHKKKIKEGKKKLSKFSLPKQQGTQSSLIENILTNVEALSLSETKAIIQKENKTSTDNSLIKTPKPLNNLLQTTTNSDAEKLAHNKIKTKFDIVRSPQKPNVHRPLLQIDDNLSRAKSIPISKTIPSVGNGKNLCETKFDEKNNMQIQNLHDASQPLPISYLKFNFDETSQKNRQDVRLLRSCRTLPPINALLVKTEPLVKIKTENLGEELNTIRNLPNSHTRKRIPPSPIPAAGAMEPLRHNYNKEFNIYTIHSLIPTLQKKENNNSARPSSGSFKFYFQTEQKKEDSQKDLLQSLKSKSFELFKKSLIKFKMLEREKRKEPEPPKANKSKEKVYYRKEKKRKVVKKGKDYLA